MKFGTKIFLSMVAPVPVVLLLGFTASESGVRLIYARTSKQTLDAAQQALLSVVDARRTRMQAVMLALQNDARVRAGVAAQEGAGEDTGIGGATPEERLENARAYFNSWIDELPQLERSANVDLVMLVGKSGKIALGRVGDLPVEDERVLEDGQVSALIGAIGEQPVAVLWSGARLRSSIPQLTRPVYVASASKMTVVGAIGGGEELVGLALLASGDVGLDAVAKTGADVLFIDGEEAIASSLGDSEQARAFAAKAARELVRGPKDQVEFELEDGDWRYYARRQRVEGLLPGVRVALLYSRADEFALRRTIERGTIGVLLLLTALAAVASRLLARSLSRPVDALAGAASQVREGHLDAKVPEDRKDELGDLSRQFNAMVQGLRERENAKSALSRYLSPEMARQLITRPEMMAMEGEKRLMTVMFSDIAGFTTLAEKLPAERVVQVLNHYLDRMVQVLWSQAAYVDKFEGDAIMAFWGAPIDQPDHAARACLAALGMREALAVLTAEWKTQGIEGLRVRWGVNSGEMVVGNLGSSNKVNYTVIGDQVNLASRLEGANREYKTEILIGEATYDGAKNAVEAREIDLLVVKGKTRPVRIFEVLAPKGALSPERKAEVDVFASALGAYRARRFDDALREFEKAAAMLGNVGGPASVFVERCRALIANPPAPDWDGTFEMKSK